ncbi:hypothetical protein LCGC14_3091180, partial [marine sediment metagenome]
AQPEIPPELQEILTVVVSALEEFGREDLAQELTAAINGAEPRPELMGEIVQVLRDNGAEDLAQALMQAIGAASGGQQAQPAAQPV